LWYCHCLWLCLYKSMGRSTGTFCFHCYLWYIHSVALRSWLCMCVWLAVYRSRRGRSAGASSGDCLCDVSRCAQESTSHHSTEWVGERKQILISSLINYESVSIVLLLLVHWPVTVFVLECFNWRVFAKDVCTVAGLHCKVPLQSVRSGTLGKYCHLSFALMMVWDKVLSPYLFTRYISDILIIKVIVH